MSKFVIRRVATGFKFDLRADNGEEILSSEVYSGRDKCRKGIESVRRNAPGCPMEEVSEGEALPNPKFQIFRDKAGEYRFRLRARNGEVIAASQGYSTRSACLAGLECVKNTAHEAEIEKE